MVPRSLGVYIGPGVQLLRGPRGPDGRSARNGGADSPDGRSRRGVQLQGQVGKCRRPRHQGPLVTPRQRAPRCALWSCRCPGHAAQNHNLPRGEERDAGRCSRRSIEDRYVRLDAAQGWRSAVASNHGLQRYSSSLTSLKATERRGRLAAGAPGCVSCSMPPRARLASSSIRALLENLASSCACGSCLGECGGVAPPAMRSSSASFPAGGCVSP